MLRRLALLTAVLAVMASSPAAAAKNEPEVVREAKLRALVDRIERHYEKHTTYQARFVQLVEVRAHDKSIVRRGAVAFKRPGKLSFRYDDGDWAVSDGKRLRAYVAAHARVYDMDAKRSLYPAALAFLRKKGKLEELFVLRRIDTDDPRAKEGVVLEALPKSASPAFAKMVLFVERQSGRVLRVLVVDAQGNTNRFVFDQEIVGKSIADARFRPPRTPKGAKVVEP